MKTRIAVVGPHREATERDLADAALIGREIALRGAVLLTGGLGGVMRAATEGAVEAGGIAVSLAPDGEDQAVEQNPRATVVLPTGTGQMRNVLLVRAAHVVVSVGCNWGTLAEIALAMREGTPTVCLRSWEIHGGEPRPVSVATAGEAVEAAFGAL